jgi:hypothetical protein
MGDHRTKTLQRLPVNPFGWHYLNLDEESIPWIMNHIDCFVSQSRGNDFVENVVLHPHACNGHDDEVWDKVGQAVGNLQAVDMLQISNNKNRVDDQIVPIPDWERLARILSHMRQKIRLEMVNDSDVWSVGEVQALARAISHGHPTITRFDSSNSLPHEATDTLYSALATLPALESVKLSSSPEEEITLANPGTLAELLRAPSLRSVFFSEFDFTSALCQATANALTEGTAVNKLAFRECKFPAGECAAIMANGLSRNTSVTHIKVRSTLEQALYDALAMALPLNLTLRRLDLDLVQRGFSDEDDRDLSPLIEALGKNMGLKTLTIHGFSSIDGFLCTAMTDGLGLNETLESLELEDIDLCDDNAALWCRAFSFLRTNKSLKSLIIVTLEQDVTESCLSAFRLDIATMLQENASLESLTVEQRWTKIKAEEYIGLVTALQHNTTLKTLSLSRNDGGSLQLNNDENKQMASLLKKNYALEMLPDIDQVGDVGAILRLNVAGRRYLIEDGSSISKGVDVLSRVNNDINCSFLHLLENPRLCDRSAVEIVEIVSTGGSNSNPTVNRGGGGKREQASAPKSRESRRRLA